MRSPFSILALCACIGLLSSCAAIKLGTSASVSKVGEGFGKMGDGFGKVAELTTSPFRPGLPVVEAREDDMRKMQSGQDQALAYQEQQRRKRGWWIFGGPVDFEEPDLPEIGDDADASLLPDLSE